MRGETSRSFDVLALLVLSLLGGAAALARVEGPLLAATILPLLLGAPGYAVLEAVKPARVFAEARGSGGRAALSSGGSVVLGAFAAILLGRWTGGVQVHALLGVLSALTFGATVAAFSRRRLAAPSPGRVRPPLVAALRWSDEPLLGKALTIALAAALLSSAGVLAYLVAVPQGEDPFTEFYVLGEGGGAGSYPTNLTAGQTGRLRLGIANHEERAVDYTARMIAERGAWEGEAGNRSFAVDGRSSLEAWNVTLPTGGKWEEDVSFALPVPGTYRLSFLLEKLGDPRSPYRAVHLWVNVRG